MMDARIARLLRSAAGRLRRLWFSIALTTSSLLLALLGSLLLWRLELVARTQDGQAWGISTWLLILGSVAIAAGYIVTGWATREPRRIAHRIEHRFPELNARLLTVLDFRPGGPTGNYTFLEQRVIREALHHDFVHGWRNIVPGPRLLLAYAMSASSLVGLIAVALLLDQWQLPTRRGPDHEALLANGPALEIEVQPGDTEIERGTSILVTARFGGDVPEDVELWSRREGGAEESVPMRRSLDDPLFAARLLSVEQPLAYRIRYGNLQSRDYEVRVFDYPRLERADVHLVFPSYTQLAPRDLVDARRITAVEGTEVTVSCHVNKPLAKAELLSATGESLALAAVEGAPRQYRATWKLAKSARYQFALRDAEGRETPPPAPELVVVVTPNKPPEVKLAMPGRDTAVSPIEELQIAGNAKDDFGVVRYGLGFRIAKGEDQEIDLSEATIERERGIQYLLDMEKLEAEPDQLVTYYLWAEDFGPDGEPRRTFSDMFFAEVRHFEEIFRQGQQPPGGGAPRGGGNQQQAEQLAEMQKQIISATWTLLRREAAEPKKRTADVQVVRESQETALEQLEALAEQVQDPESIRYVDEGRQAMQTAITQLKAAEAAGREALTSALAAEQSAYQALLGLRAREHEVVRSQSSSSSSSSGSSSSRSQQQLDQLELKDSPNRYETESQAQSPENPAEREVRQALSRLRELARRQEDMNKRLQELQSALEQAASAEQRAELEQQLKRLREEQQQILRDTDELQQRLEQPQNQEQMRSEQQQLSETRENVRRASEALEQGQVSQALAAGTRAQRELEQMQDELRRKSASQFAEQMRTMREEARRLAEDQEQLVNQLDTLPEQESRSLRGSSQRAEAEQTLEQQRERFDRVLEQMRQTVQDAEASEPLLSNRLYETYRQAQQDKPGEALAQAAEWLERGFSEEATAPAKAAQEGLTRMAAGIEQAAEGVLGDETEALRRARSELDRLAEQLQEEIARAAPDQAAPSDNAKGSNASGDPASESASESTASASQPGSAARPQPDGNAERPGERPANAEENSAPERENRESRPADSNDSERSGAQPPAAEAREPGEEPGGSAGEPREASSAESSEEPRGGAPNDSPEGEAPSPRSPAATPGSATATPAGSPGGRQGDQPAGSPPAASGSSGGEPNGLGGLADLIEGATGGAAPLTGEDYLDWSDRLRDVEEMLDDSELRAAAARIRDRARAARLEYRRHSREPKWDLVAEEIARPLFELRDRVEEELRRRTGDDELAPIDRDPVPPEFADEVERYYERLGSGR